MSFTLALLRSGIPLLLTVRLPSISLNSTTIQAILALFAGVLILIRPKNLNFIVAGYLITLGIVLFFRLSL